MSSEVRSHCEQLHNFHSSQVIELISRVNIAQSYRLFMFAVVLRFHHADSTADQCLSICFPSSDKGSERK